MKKIRKKNKLECVKAQLRAAKPLSGDINMKLIDQTGDDENLKDKIDLWMDEEEGMKLSKAVTFLRDRVFTTAETHIFSSFKKIEKAVTLVELLKSAIPGTVFKTCSFSLKNLRGFEGLYIHITLDNKKGN